MFEDAIKARRKHGAKTILFDLSKGVIRLSDDTEVTGEYQFSLYVGRGAGPSSVLAEVAETKTKVLFNHESYLKIAEIRKNRGEK